MNEGIHYSAFISYKHAPADIAVAAEIQKRLERYHIPGAIRKKIGKDKIGRIFRDKEELPITSDLSDDISRALEDADFLIVICSSSTKLSTWVPREIDYFLQFHERKRVLTVLVDGEPADVIPERLLKDTVVRTAPDGTQYEEEVPCEPLSCDFRNGIKAARREEIPRLAAALLGCTYDELVMRERQYKRRRRMAIGVPAVIAMIVAIGYLSWSRQEIAENLRQAQINQSEFLCNQAEELFEEGDRIRAMQLVMEALPSEENDRPLSPRAMKRLAQVLHAYRAEGIDDVNNAADTCASFETEGKIRQFQATRDGLYLYALDENGMLYLWDLRNYEQVLELGPRTASRTVGRILDADYIDDKTIVIQTVDGISACGLPDGNVIWEYTDADVAWDLSGMETASKASEITIAQVSPRPESAEDDSLVTLYDVDMTAIDSQTGQIKAESSVLEGAKEKVLVDLIGISDDDAAGAAALAIHIEDDDVRQVYVWNKKKNSVREAALDHEPVIVQALRFDDDGELFVMSLPPYGEYTDASGVNELYTTTAAREICVSCLAAGGDKCLWKTSFYSPQINRLKIGRGLGMLNTLDKVMCQYANKSVLLNMSDGSLYDEVECTASIVNTGKNDAGYFIMQLENGMISVYGPEEKGIVRNTDYFKHNVKGITWINSETEGGQVRYLAQPDDYRIWLNDAVYDDQFTAFEGDAIPAQKQKHQFALTDHAVFYMTQDNIIYIYDLEKDSLSRQVKLDDATITYKYLGTDDEKDIFWLFETGDYSEPDKLVGVDSSGSIRRVSLREGISYKEYLMAMYLMLARFNAWGENHMVLAGLFDGTDGQQLPVVLSDGRFAWRDGRSLIIGHTEGESLVTDHSLDTGYIFESCYLSEDENKALLLDPGVTALLDAQENEDTKEEDWNAMLESPLNPVIVLLDTTTGKETVLENPFYSEPVQGIFSKSGSRAAVTDGEKVVIYGEDGSILAQLSETGREVVNISGYKDELIVLYSNGLLARYDWQSGKSSGQTNVSHYTVSSDYQLEQGRFSRYVNWEYIEGKLYLYSYGTGALLQVIDLQTWEEELASDKILAYDPVRDRMLAMDKDEQTGDRHLGWFPHYTVEDLRKKALEALHGEELSPEERDLYGLD